MCLMTLPFRTFPRNVNTTLLKNAPGSGSELPTLVSTVLCDEATGSEMHNAPELQE